MKVCQISSETYDFLCLKQTPVALLFSILRVNMASLTVGIVYSFMHVTSGILTSDNSCVLCARVQRLFNRWQRFLTDVHRSCAAAQNCAVLRRVYYDTIAFYRYNDNIIDLNTSSRAQRVSRRAYTLNDDVIHRDHVLARRCCVSTRHQQLSSVASWRLSRTVRALGLAERATRHTRADAPWRHIRQRPPTTH